MSKIRPEDLAKSGTEHGHQAALFCWAAENLGQYPKLRALFAIPNGGERHAAVAGKLKAEGVKRGVPDIMLAVPIYFSNGTLRRCGLFIEMKVGKNTPTEEQQQWLKFLAQSGYSTCVCYSWQEARDGILMYLNGE